MSKRRHPGKTSKPVAMVTATIPTTIANFDRELIRQVQAKGYDVCVVSSPGPELTRIGDQMGVRVRAVPMTREISPFADLIALIAWLGVCLSERPSVKISATPKASLLSLLAAKLTRVPGRLYCLVGLRLESEHGMRRSLLALMEKITSWAATQVVANSPSLAARYGELALAPARKLRQTIPEGGARMTAAVLIIGAGVSADRKAGVGAAVSPRVACATTVIGVPVDQGCLGHLTISRSRGRTARV